MCVHDVSVSDVGENTKVGNEILEFWVKLCTQ